MKHVMVLLVLSAVLIASMACSVSIPSVDIMTGPETETDIEVPRLSDPAQEAFVTLSSGANELRLSPGATEGLVSGTVRTNVKDFEPTVKIDGSDIRIEQGDLNVDGIPNISADDVINKWDLQLGSDPIRLRVTGGAYEGDMDLGGLALTDLYISDGAASVKVDFSAPNTVEMSSLRYETGASTVEMMNLANANFTSMIFRSGAGTYTLDFGGALRRDAQVDIESGLSTLKIVVPEGTAAEVEISGSMSSVETHGAWVSQDSTRYHVEGQGPRLLIDVSMGAGTVILETR
ncbi:MAG: toast rack family protein [Chloroflexi bacterium]|nr:toast rack family protein [Chloroflexota bacterium]